LHKTKQIKTLQHILFFLVLTILVIHSVTPHNHDHTLDGETIKLLPKQDSFLGIVKNCLSYNLGEGHLEHFLSSKSAIDQSFQQVPPNIHLNLFVPSNTIDFPKHLNCFDPNEVVLIQKQYAHKTNVLRGPPRLT